MSQIGSIKVGDKALITTDAWFIAPDGDQYRAVFGTIHGVFDSEDSLGVKTNDRSTNWYLLIGNMMVAGCQIHYAIKTDTFNPDPIKVVSKDRGISHERFNLNTNIYDADQNERQRDATS